VGNFCNCSHDADIACAATQVARKLLPNGPFVDRAKPLDDIAARNEHTRRTKPALQGMMLRKCSAQAGHDGIVDQSFDRLNVLLFELDRVRDARANGCSVGYDRASAADSVLATQMSPCQAAAVTKEVAQARASFDFAGSRKTVNLHRH
jgi:hypothetical protein